MAPTATPTGTTPLAALPDDQHRARWMLNSLLVERATSEETGGAYTLLEQWVSPAGNPPPHVHEHEDEAFLVLEGTVDVTVGDRTHSIGAGEFAFGPRGVPHTYAVTSDVARLLVVATPGGLEHFFADLGSPAEEMVLPDPQAPDVGVVVATAARYGITILPPPSPAA